VKLGDYFEKRRGIGVLATANARGKVAIALYARPHAAGGKTVEFIMADRLSRRNLVENPRAAYLFVERGDGYRGLRLYLTRTGEERDSSRIGALRRTRPVARRRSPGPRFLVSFRVDRVLPLVGPPSGGSRRAGVTGKDVHDGGR
jgi:hypothetical protein